MGDLEKLIDLLNAKSKAEGGLLFGITGISSLEYFAAHAPTRPEDYGKGQLLTEVQAIAKWRWEFAQAMIDAKAKKAVEDPETIAKLKHERRGFQLMARNMMAGHDPGFWQSAMADGKYERVGGDAPCLDCGIAYVDHPELPGFPTFHTICSGDIVKT